MDNINDGNSIENKEKGSKDDKIYHLKKELTNANRKILAQKNKIESIEEKEKSLVNAASNKVQEPKQDEMTKKADNKQNKDEATNEKSENMSKKLKQQHVKYVTKTLRNLEAHMRNNHPELITQNVSLL